MATQRYISSSFWSDDWVDSLSIKEKLLYMYLLTNECTSICGVYKITIKRIKDDTGISREEVQDILNAFAKAKKAYYVNEYIILPTWLKHQHLNNQKVNLGVRRALNSLPNNIIDFLKEEEHFYYNIDDFISNNKSETKNDNLYPKAGEKLMSDSKKEEKTNKTYQNTLLSANDSDLDSDLDYDLDIQTNQEIYKRSESEIATADKPPALAKPPPFSKASISNNKRFLKPNIQDIQAYCLERKNNIDAETFYDFYESVGWKVGNKTMKDWRASIRTWERRNRQQRSQPKTTNKSKYDFNITGSDSSSDMPF